MSDFCQCNDGQCARCELDAMVDVACRAYFNASYTGGKGSGTSFTWDSAGDEWRAGPRRWMLAALTATLWDADPRYTLTPLGAAMLEGKKNGT